jgi:hypothetical protein
MSTHEIGERTRGVRARRIGAPRGGMRGTGLWSTGPQTLARTGGASGVRAGGGGRSAWAGESVRGRAIRCAAGELGSGSAIHGGSTSYRKRTVRPCDDNARFILSAMRRLSESPTEFIGSSSHRPRLFEKTIGLCPSLSAVIRIFLQPSRYTRACFKNTSGA